MNVTNRDTIAAYNNGIEEYYNLSPQKVSGHIKTWIDSALSGLPKDSKLLEIGSGTGKDAVYINSLGYKLKLTDASQGFVDYLQQQGMDAVTFDVLEDDFNDKYDLIFADAVMLHFADIELEKIFKKVWSALLPKGRFALTVKKGDGEFTEDKKLGMLRYFHLWQPEQLIDKLEDSGFSLTFNEIADDKRGDKPSWILIIAEKRIKQ